MKQVRGFSWPDDDIDCAAVVFDRLGDLGLAMRECRDTRVVVQAGGNAGVWPKYLASHFEQVYTFEPEPDNFACLVLNCPEQNIHAYHAALGRTGTGGVSLSYEHGRRNLGAVFVSGPGPIPLMRLDDFPFEALDLIQLDVEGYETEILAGAVATLARHRPVLMVEDKGLSKIVGVPQGWSDTFPGYRVAARVERDVILVPEEV